MNHFEKLKSMTIEEATERLEYYKARMNEFWDKANRMLERQYGLILSLKIINEINV